MEVSLFSGGIDANNLVARINVPPFNPMPNAIQWGGRYYFLVAGTQTTYLEGFLWSAYPRS